MKNKHTMLPKKVKEVIVMLGITITYLAICFVMDAKKYIQEKD